MYNKLDNVPRQRIYVKPGSMVLNLLTVLSYTGEFPVYSAYTLGNERMYKKLIKKMQVVQDYRFDDGEVISVKALNQKGTGYTKTIVLGRGSLALYDKLGMTWAQHAYDNVTGQAVTTARHHAIGEVLAMCMRSDIFKDFTFAKDFLNEDINYISELDVNNKKKTIFTRVIGFYGNHAIYNTRSAKALWASNTETKVRTTIQLKLGNVGKAILFGATYENGLKMISSDFVPHYGRKSTMFSQVFPEGVCFIPFGDFGAKLLKLIDEDVRSAVADVDEGLKAFEYDCVADNKYIYVFLDSDIGRLYKFGAAKNLWTGRAEIYCYHEQLPFLKEYFADADVTYKLFSIDSVLKYFGKEETVSD